MLTVQQSDTVWSDQGRSVLFAGIEDALFQEGPLVGLLTEAGRDDHEGPDALLATEILHIVGTVFGCHHEYCQIGLWQFLHIVTGLDALYVVFLRVDNPKFTLIAPVDDVSDDRTTGLMDIIGAANHDDTPWIQQLFVYHRCKDSANRIKYQIYLDIFEMQPIFDRRSEIRD